MDVPELNSRYSFSDRDQISRLIRWFVFVFQCFKRMSSWLYCFCDNCCHSYLYSSVYNCPFSLAAFKISCLSLVLYNLMMVCLGIVFLRFLMCFFLEALGKNPILDLFSFCWPPASLGSWRLPPSSELTAEHLQINL